MKSSLALDKIVVLDFGSQYNQLIVRRIRELGVYAELLPHSTKVSEFGDLEHVKGIILSGGPHSVYGRDAFFPDPLIYQLEIPILGICYGMQLIAKQFGGMVTPSEIREYGRKGIEVVTPNRLFEGTPNVQSVWMSHGDEVLVVPEGFSILARSDEGLIASIGSQAKSIYGLQFHPEVRHTEYGMTLLKQFALNVCDIQPSWSMSSFVEIEIKRIQEIVQKNAVLMAISGGVDSGVAAVLIHKAIGDQLTCMFIDHGMLRKNEAEEVMATFADKYGIRVTKIDAKERFFQKLAGIDDPETKRKIIGAEFIAVFQEEADRLGSFPFLGQGTLYTDVIESGTKTAQTIKSHHNVGGLPKDMKFQLLEPLNRLFKDEVRKLGLELGIDPAIVQRQPFPGPGLAIRILGSISEEKLAIVRETDAILREEIRLSGLADSVWQYFTVLPGIHSVGVMGDQRTYQETIVIRAVTSIDGMTADWARLPFEVLDKVSRRIVNEVRGVNRVVYDITSKPPSTIEWE